MILKYNMRSCGPVASAKTTEIHTHVATNTFKQIKDLLS